jgi:hypothetical protein
MHIYTSFEFIFDAFIFCAQGLQFVGKWAGDATVINFDLGNVLLSSDVSIRLYMFEGEKADEMCKENAEDLKLHGHMRSVYKSLHMILLTTYMLRAEELMPV